MKSGEPVIGSHKTSHSSVKLIAESIKQIISVYTIDNKKLPENEHNTE